MTAWTVRVSTRHTGEDHQGQYGSEAEAAAEAMRMRQQFAGCGVHFEAARLPDDLAEPVE